MLYLNWVIKLPVHILWPEDLSLSKLCFIWMSLLNLIALSSIRENPCVFSRHVLLSAILVLFPWTVELWTSFACLEIMECSCICIQAVVESYMRLWHHRLMGIASYQNISYFTNLPTFRLVQFHKNIAKIFPWSFTGLIWVCNSSILADRKKILFPWEQYHTEHSSLFT